MAELLVIESAIMTMSHQLRSGDGALSSILSLLLAAVVFVFLVILRIASLRSQPQDEPTKSGGKPGKEAPMDVAAGASLETVWSVGAAVVGGQLLT